MAAGAPPDLMERDRLRQQLCMRVVGHTPAYVGRRAAHGASATEAINEVTMEQRQVLLSGILSPMALK